MIAERPNAYASPAILERRRRILEETRKVIAEQGIGALSMQDIGQRAGVAKRTLYNAFQTRERMIASAIQHFFEEFISQYQFASPPATLRYNIERLMLSMPRTRVARNQTRAIMTIYFSQDTEADIWTTIHDISRRPNMAWLEMLHGKRQLQPWIEAGKLADDLVRLEYVTIAAWAQGHMAEEEAGIQLVMAYLTHVAGATRGDARREAEDLLKLIQEEGLGVISLPQLQPAPVQA